MLQRWKLTRHWRLTSPPGGVGGGGARHCQQGVFLEGASRPPTTAARARPRRPPTPPSQPQPQPRALVLIFNFQGALAWVGWGGATSSLLFFSCAPAKEEEEEEEEVPGWGCGCVRGTTDMDEVLLLAATAAAVARSQFV